MKEKCDHPSFERIGVLRDGIYSETEEKCKECGYIREIGEGDWKELRRILMGEEK
jgi:hypothetical protein